MISSMRHQFVSTNGITLHVVAAGPDDGPLLIFLHGFPEFWFGWRQQIGFFAELGYRVIVPDQRGYNLSDKPRGVAAYALETLARDVVGLIDAEGRETALLVGHDWGAIVAWWVAVRYPRRLQKLAILNAPHPIVMRRHLWRDRRQRKKSRYIFFFQLPWLPEWRLRKNDWHRAARALQATSRSGTFSDDDLQFYRRAWESPGAITAMVNWYRAALRKQPARIDSPRISVPTLLIWGKKDRFLGHDMAQPSVDMCDRGQVLFLENASHWLQHEEPERVNRALQLFLQS